MVNPAQARTGDLVLTAGCQPDPVTAAEATHDVTIENMGSDTYFVGEVQVHVLQGGPGSGLLLEYNGRPGYLLSLAKAGTFAQWSQGSWALTAKRQNTDSRGEMIRTTVTFDRSAVLDPLDPTPPVRLACLCDVDIVIR